MEKKIAPALLIAIILGVVINNSFLMREIDLMIEEVDRLEIDKNGTKTEAEHLFSYYMDKQRFISLSVSHEDLCEIENSFVELIGYLSIGDGDSAAVAKSRLKHSFEHLRRLSGFNIDALI